LKYLFDTVISKHPAEARHSLIPALESLRLEDCEFEASLGYIVKSCLKQTNKLSCCKTSKSIRRLLEPFRKDCMIGIGVRQICV
jgi:hypothetical protein